MKIVQINAYCGTGSTGKICVSVSRLMSENNIENYLLYTLPSAGYELGIQCSDMTYHKIQALKSRVLGNYGFNSNRTTRRMITELNKIEPDVVHLHNIHCHACNIEMLLEYLKNKRIKVLWTLHDCWMFTGYCTHFTLKKCDKWKNGCRRCVQRKSFSWFFDKSSALYQRKKKATEKLDLTIITPSKWLAGLVKQSFLKDYPVKVINNGINLDVFKPTENAFREKHNLQDKRIVLGVSFEWGYSKGLDVYVALSNILPKDYQVVLVGTNDTVDKHLPSNIISIHRTNDQKELAEIYSTADVFVNATREDTYPTVNMEAIACGTPVVTFRTGGSPEIITEGVNGMVVDCDDAEGMKNAIIKICTELPSMQQGCLEASKQFDMNDRFQEYLDLYKSINGINTNKREREV